MKGIWQIIVAVIAIVIIVVTILLLHSAFREYFTFLKQEGKEKIEESKSNFFLFGKNIEECKKSEKNNCLCMALENYPATFPRKVKLMFEETSKGTNISVSYGNVQIQSETEARFSVALVDEYGNINIEKGKQIDYKKKWIDWSYEPPVFCRDGLCSKGTIFGIGKKQGPFIVSPFLLKKDNVFYFFVSFKAKRKKEMEKKFEKC